MEQYFVFLKNNRVTNIGVFQSEDQELADQIVAEQGFDTAIWVGKNKPVMFSEYDGKKFIEPTEDYLISIGVKTLETEKLPRE